jgi:osmotically-inducible protein OsmY
MKRHVVLIYSLAVISILSVLALAEGSASRVPTRALADDAAIQKCIEDKVAASATLKSDGIGVSVVSGVATLTGHVKNMGAKGAATNVAKSCGPKSIANNITVDKAAPIDDGAIQKCISDKLAASGSLNPQGFSATVSGGVATLTGTAKDAGSKGAATNIAKKCGAKKVTNNITAPAVGKH